MHSSKAPITKIILLRKKMQASMKRNLLFIFVLMIVPFTVKAQIKGVVCDENQNPVEFANVILMGTDSVYI